MKVSAYISGILGTMLVLMIFGLAISGTFGFSILSDKKLTIGTINLELKKDGRVYFGDFTIQEGDYSKWIYIGNVATSIMSYDTVQLFTIGDNRVSACSSSYRVCDIISVDDSGNLNYISIDTPQKYASTMLDLEDLGYTSDFSTINGKYVTSLVYNASKGCEEVVIYRYNKTTGTYEQYYVISLYGVTSDNYALFTVISPSGKYIYVYGYDNKLYVFRGEP